MISQTPWFQRTFHFDFPVENFPVIFSRLEGSIFRLEHLLKNVNDKACSHNDKGWSVKQHVGHLYDLEDLWWRRLEDFKQNKPVLSAADLNNTKTWEAGHNEKPVEQLLGMFASERQKILQGIVDFDAEILTRTSLHPRLQQPMRVVDSLYFVAEHDDNHIAILSNLLRKPNN